MADVNLILFYRSIPPPSVRWCVRVFVGCLLPTLCTFWRLFKPTALLYSYSFVSIVYICTSSIPAVPLLPLSPFLHISLTPSPPLSHRLFPSLPLPSPLTYPSLLLSPSPAPHLPLLPHLNPFSYPPPPPQTPHHVSVGACTGLEGVFKTTTCALGSYCSSTLSKSRMVKGFAMNRFIPACKAES